MDIIKDIPARVGVTHSVNDIVIDLRGKTATCIVTIEDHGLIIQKHIVVDVMPILVATTEAQKTIIKGFFKQIIATGVGVALAQVPNIFE